MKIWIRCDYGDFSVIIEHDNGKETILTPTRNTLESAFLMAQAHAKAPLQLSCLFAEN